MFLKVCLSVVRNSHEVAFHFIKITSIASTVHLQYSKLRRSCFNTCLFQLFHIYIFFLNSQESRTEESPSYINVTLDHKTSHVGQFFEIEIYAPSES